MGNGLQPIAHIAAQAPGAEKYDLAPNRHPNLPGESFIELAVTVTVLLSVFAHGTSAAPAITVYAEQVERMDADAPERHYAATMPVRN